MSVDNTVKKLEASVIELETKLSFQDDLLQELNTHVIAQESRIEKLETLCNLLKDQYREIVSSMPDAASGDEVPPHY